MENISIENDIAVLCMTATEFPQGIPEVWNKMFTGFPPKDGRNYYGVSYPGPDKKIIYKATVIESSVKDPDKKGLESFVIKKGKYISENIADFKKDEMIITQTFQKLLDSGEIAKDGICLEIYSDDNSVRCLVTHK